MFLQSISHAVVSRALPASPSSCSSTLPLLHYKNTAAVFEHHPKGFGGLRGLGAFLGHRSKARQEIGPRVGNRGCCRKATEGLKFRLGSGLQGTGGEECSAALKEEDCFAKPQEELSSSSADEEAVSSMEGKSLWRKLAQNVNVAGVSFSARVIAKDRHLAIPHVSVPDISWIDWKALRTRGFEGVVFDKDNTLTAPYGKSIWPPLADSLEECREVFGGRIALLSNSAGLYQYDPSGAEAKVLENRLGIPVIRHGQKKPAGNALALSSYFGCDPTMLIMVGDRYFTDVVYGNSNGLLTIRPAPLTTHGEPFVVKRVRGLEDALVDWWSRQGCQPPKHNLFDNPVEFIKDPGCW